MNNAAPSTKSPRTVTCAKCDGRGKINAFYHRASGRCFACGGAGTVEVTHAQVVSGAKSNASACVEVLVEDAADGAGISDVTVDRLAHHLFEAADTRFARKLLDNLARRAGHDFRAAVIEAGRRMKTAA